MTRTRLAPLALGAALALVLPACGDDESPTTSTEAATTSVAGGDVDRYCELTAELDAMGEQLFADLSQDAAPEEVVQREQQLVEQASAHFDELVEVAPDAIADDVPVLLDGIRARAATGEDPDQEASSAAEERILAFEEENCP
jgi:hypothetical protein